MNHPLIAGRAPPSYRGQHYAHPEELRSAQMRPHELQRAELNARARRVGVKEWHAHTAPYWHRVDLCGR